MQPSARRTAAAANEGAQHTRELEDISRRIKQQQAELETVRNQEEALLDRLHGLDTRIVAGQRDIRKTAAEIQVLEKDTAGAMQRLDDISQALRARQGKLAQRLQALYKYQRRGGLLLLLGAESYHDFLMREKLLTTVAAADRRLLEQHHVDYTRSQAAATQLQVRRDELAARRASYNHSLGVLKSDRGKKQQLLASVRHEKKLQIQTLRELEVASQKLQSVIDQLGRDTAYSTSGTPFARMKGRLPHFPVRPP